MSLRQNPRQPRFRLKRQFRCRPAIPALVAAEAEKRACYKGQIPMKIPASTLKKMALGATGVAATAGIAYAASPLATPTAEPVSTPTPTAVPTTTPTVSPTVAPTAIPTVAPTAVPFTDYVCGPCGMG